MKYLIHAGRCGALSVLFLLMTVPTAFAQNYCDTINHNVQVAMWELPTPNGMVSQKSAIQKQLVDITNAVLDAINSRRQPTNPQISASLLSKLEREFNGAYCVRKGRVSQARPLANGQYNLLIVPAMKDPDIYEIRGLHLISNSTGTADLPQAILSFKIAGSEVTLTDIRVETKAQREARSQARMPADPRAMAAFNVVKNLEAAYNEDGEGIITSLGAVLNDAAAGDVEVVVSKLGFPDRKKNASRYLAALRRNVSIYGETEITYEFVDVYQLPNTDVYRVTLVQHWMYENLYSYVDSDFIALDVVFKGDQPVIVRRQAGRGAFNVYSRPSNVQITRFNGDDWSNANPPHTTPFEHIINAPLQYHRLRLENIWYAPVEASRSPEDVLKLQNITVEMEHLDGNIVLNVLPEPRGATVLINGRNEQDVVNGRVIPVRWSELGGVPPPDGAITSDERTVQVEVRHPDLDPDTFFDQTITLPSPDPLTLNVPYPNGILAVASIPTASTVLINGQESGLTRLEKEMPVTPKDAPLIVEVRNDTCLPGTPESECLLHIPSEGRDVHIEPQKTTEEVFNLMPFLIRDETGAGKITAFPIERDGNLISVKYYIEDAKGRNRKFFVDFDLDQVPADDKIADLEGEVTCGGSQTSQNRCLGSKMRPGEYEFTWDMSNWTDTMDQNNMPVLTLRKPKCWPCVLIPAAAGVAAAYIWPRTGKGGNDGSFIPPPRP